eukprot:1289683-Alexandrium_andersonii.AAC.1
MTWPGAWNPAKKPGWPWWPGARPLLRNPRIARAPLGEARRPAANMIETWGQNSCCWVRHGVCGTATNLIRTWDEAAAG